MPLIQIYILGGCYCLLFLLCFLIGKMKSETLHSEKVLNGNWILLHMHQVAGIIILAVLPASLTLQIPGNMFLWPSSDNIIKWLTLIITALMLITLAIINRYGGSFEKHIHPQGSIFDATLYIALRTGFLISYEIFFRGYILISCLELFGALPAIIINVLLYTLIHSFNGKKEMYGSVPFGLILCVFTLWFQSVWPAILLHLLLSSSHEFFLLSPFFKNSKPVL